MNIPEFAQGYTITLKVDRIELGIILNEKPTKEKYDETVARLSKLIWERL